MKGLLQRVLEIDAALHSSAMFLQMAADRNILSKPCQVPNIKGTVWKDTNKKITIKEWVSTDQ